MQRVSAMAEPPVAPDLHQVDQKQNDERDGEHDRGNRSGGRVVALLQAKDDEQRQDFGLSWNVAGNEDDRAIFADRTGEREREAGEDRRDQRRQNDAQDRGSPRRAERGCGLFNLAVEVLEYRLDGANDERQADEDKRDPDADRRIRDGDAERREQTGRASPAERRARSAQCRRPRRQREGQVDDRVKQTPGEEAIAHQHPGDHHADHDIEQRGQQRGAETQSQGGQESRSRHDARRSDPSRVRMS